MPIVFACAAGHAPGIVAWPEAAPVQQKDSVYGAFHRLQAAIAAARLDRLILFTAEHWTNYFLDHMSAFCVGRADHFNGPVEPWLRIQKSRIPGDPSLAAAILEHSYANGIEPGFAHEMQLDHGTMVPLSFLTPDMNVPVVPIIINTLARPFPSVGRCLQLGRAVGAVATQSPLRIGLIATGGMSHDPGERNHGMIFPDFDQRFLAQMAAGDLEALEDYTTDGLLQFGTGAVELLSWIGVAGALQSFRGEVLAYEAVKPWATGIGLMILTGIDDHSVRS